MTPGPPPTEAETSGAGALEDVVRRAMLGQHRHLVQVRGGVARYEPEVGPFMTMPDEPGAADWDDALRLCGSESVMLVGDHQPPSKRWSIQAEMHFQLLAHPGGLGQPDAQVEDLTPGDVGAMMRLVEQTHPGPFSSRTIETGTYLGLREEGDLIAMAGERWRVPGYAEISMVCTASAHRGRGLATRMTRAVAAAIEARGERAFLHVETTNDRAAKLYRDLGFAPVLDHTVRGVAMVATPDQ